MTDLAAAGEPLVRARLVPVEVFGADEEDCPDCPASIRVGYGLMDAVSAWSDCNRAIGRIYRVDDMPEVSNDERDRDCITVYVPRSELEKLKRRFGDSGGLCPGCHRPYTALAPGHRVRPVCEVVTS